MNRACQMCISHIVPVLVLSTIAVHPHAAVHAQQGNAIDKSTQVNLVAEALRVPAYAFPVTKELLVAIDTNGDVAWFESSASGPIGTLTIGTGSQPRLVRFAKRGNGPGEVRNPWFATFSKAGLLVYEPVGRRIMQFDRRGVVKTDKVTSPVVAVAEDRAVSLSLSGTPVLQVVNADLSTSRRLTRASDTTWLRLARRHTANESTEPFAAAMVGDTVYLSTTIEGAMYRLVPGSVLLRFGPDIPPRLRTDAEVDDLLKLMSLPVRGPNGQRIVPAISADTRRRAERQHIRQVSPFSGLQVDGLGRLWRIRITASGAFADIFRGTSLVQTLTLPCSPTPRGVSVAGRWLLLACLDERDDAESEIVLQRFRF